MTRQQKGILAAYSAFAAGVLAYMVVIPALKGLFTDGYAEGETFNVTVFDLTTSVEEDLEIIGALKSFFENNTIAIGSDGATAWALDA